MKLVVSKVSIGEFVSRNKFLSFLIESSLNVFFKSVRLFYRFFANNNNSLVLISLHRLGDTVFTIPAIRELKTHIKEKVTIVCFSESVPIYKLAFDDIDFCELRHDDFYLNDRFVKHHARNKVKELKPGFVLDLIGGLSSASLLFNSRAKRVVGISQKNFRAIYDHFVQIREKPKLMDIYFDAASTIVEIPYQDRLEKLSKSFNSSGKILVHPFAAWREKEWSLKKYFELAVRVRKEYEVQIVSPVGKLPQDIKNEIMKVGIELIETKSVDELINRIKECSLFIGNDSGPVNIANFIGKATFTIYGATNPAYTASTEEHQPYIQNKLTCTAGTDSKFCLVGGAEFYCSGKQCMNFLSVDEIYKAIKSLIEANCKEVDTSAEGD